MNKEINAIDDKYIDLVQEIEWRLKHKDYEEDDKEQVCMHETIDKEVSFISVAEVDKLINCLGASKVIEIQQSYIDEFGEFPDKSPIDKKRLLLYWYFEDRYNNE